MIKDRTPLSVFLYVGFGVSDKVILPQPLAAVLQVEVLVPLYSHSILGGLPSLLVFPSVDDKGRKP